LAEGTVTLGGGEQIMLSEDGWLSLLKFVYTHLDAPCPRCERCCRRTGAQAGSTPSERPVRRWLAPSLSRLPEIRIVRFVSFIGCVVIVKRFERIANVAAPLGSFGAPLVGRPVHHVQRFGVRLYRPVKVGVHELEQG